MADECKAGGRRGSGAPKETERKTKRAGDARKEKGISVEKAPVAQRKLRRIVLEIKKDKKKTPRGTTSRKNNKETNFKAVLAKVGPPNSR